MLDVNTPNLGDITVNGTLLFSDSDLHLTADNIIVHGTLQIGTENAPFQSSAVITLTEPNPDRDIMSMGGRGILVMGGTLELHGRDKEPTWTQINANADAGTKQITLKEATAWQAGDKIAIAPTDYFSMGRSELNTISTVNGIDLSLADSLQKSRWGQLQYILDSGISLTPPNSGQIQYDLLDERAEIANLTRNIVIEGANDAAWQNEEYGAQVKFMTGSTAHIENTEFRRVGQAGRLGRYPIHFHHMSYDSSGNELADLSGQYVRNNAVWQSSQRCVVLHATNGMTVEGNVCYDIKGHAFFLEDAVERRNVIRGNLALHINAVDDADLLLAHEKIEERSGPAGFWITNPDNIVENNVAADSVAMGFWLSFPATSLGESKNVNIYPANMSPLSLSGFVTHSNGHFGMMFDLVASNDAGDLVGLKYTPRVGEVPSGASIPFKIENMLSYKHFDLGGGGAFWNNTFKGTYHQFKVADFTGFGFKGASNICTISDGLAVGTSLNTPSDSVGNQPPPVGMASYHSECIIDSNTFVNLPMVPGKISGAFSTNDYYVRAVDCGFINNINNVFINSDPGWRAPSPNIAGTDNFAFAGAICDPDGLWQDPSKDAEWPSGSYWVYDLPYLTDGTDCVDALPGGNGKSCIGPYFGVSQFLFNGATKEWTPVNMHRTDNDTDWYVPDGALATQLGAMRHAAVLNGKEYILSFPGTAPTTAFSFRVENLKNTTDNFILAVPYSGTNAPALVFTNTWPSLSGVYGFQSYQAWKAGDSTWKSKNGAQYWEPYTEVGSLTELRNSAGGSFWFDAGSQLVWLKFVGQRISSYSDPGMSPTDFRIVQNPMDVVIDESMR